MKRIMQILFAGLLFVFSLCATGATSSTEKFVDSIKSVKQAKSELKVAFERLDQCQFGSCYEENSIAICEIVGALDAKIDGEIIGAMNSGGQEIDISAEDLHEMKELFAQCKPTNYQYWNYERVLHVGYRPSKEADASIRKYLGVKKRN
jgi:hypothetical protein